MRSFALGAISALSVLSGVTALCSAPCLDNQNGTFLTCDDAVAQFGFTCEELEVWHCCDCSSCCEDEVTTTTLAPCDEPCLGAYSANDIVTMLAGDTEACTDAINNDIAPDCELSQCGCGTAECLEVQDDCGFSCAALVEAGFTCQDTLDAGCGNCTDCGCTNETTTPVPDACDTPCYAEFDISCNFLNSNGYTCDMAEELGCDCTGCGCEIYEDVCDAALYNVTVEGPLYSCHDLCAPSGDAIRAAPSVGNFSTLQLIRLGINCLHCDCYDTTPTTTTTSTSTTTTSTTTTTTSTLTTTSSTTTTFNITEGCFELIPGSDADGPGYSCHDLMFYLPECAQIENVFGYDCEPCGCIVTTSTSTTTTTTTTTSTTITTTTSTTTTTTTATTTTNSCAECLVSLGSDGSVYTCQDLTGGFQGIDSPFGELLGGEFNGLSDGSVWTCAYLEEEYGCDCSDCGCVDPPNTTSAACPATCSGPEGIEDFDCDATIDALDYQATCGDLEAIHGCDCLGCQCMEGYCANKEVGTAILGENETMIAATCDLLNEEYNCASLLRGEHDADGFNYSTSCVDFGCGCTECVNTCLGDKTCDEWLVVNDEDSNFGLLSCSTLESDPYGCDCGGCECREPYSPCSAQCGPGSEGALAGLQAFADEQGILSCDDWGAFFTEETFSCAYLEHEWGCDCRGCECDSNPQCQTEVECKLCDTDVFNGNCDEIYAQSGYSLSCEISEESFGCDCAGCACMVPEITNTTCEQSCLGYNCNEILPVFGGDMTCDSLEGLGFDCSGCSGCEYYDICDSYRYGFSNGFIDNQPKFQAASCDGSPIRTAGAFSFCDCANLCEVTDSCDFFDNVGLNCRLFAADECATPNTAGEMTGVWAKP